MKLSIIFICIFLLWSCATPSDEEDRPKDEINYEQLAMNFVDPPREARPKALWTWLNGNVDMAMLTREMAEASEKGLGGFDIWDVGMLVDQDSIVPKGPPFMSEESVNAISHALNEAKKFDMEMGLTISSSWNAGGDWVKEEHGVMGLFRSVSRVKGPGNRTLDMRVTPIGTQIERADSDDKPRRLKLDANGLPEFRKDVALLAIPLREDSVVSSAEIVDLTDKLAEEGPVTWDVPEGNWLVIRYTCMPTGQPLALPSANSKGLMIDHFSAEAMESHLKFFFEKLKPATGDFRNSPLLYFYTDSYEANSAAWTPKMPEEFKRLRGYDMKTYLPVLDGFTIDDREVSGRFAYDYRKTLSDLIIANHYALGKKLCNEQGIGFAAEAGGPGPPVHNVPFQDLAALGALDIPRGEFWYKHPRGQKHMDELQIIKGIASAAHIYDQKFVEAESFTSIWLWQEGPKDLKPVADKAFCEGLNRIVYHTFPHIPEEAGHPGWIYNFGTVMNTHRAWWPKSRAWNDYLARVSYVLQQGNFVADVAYYYGNEAPNIVGHKRTFSWLGEGYDYDVINTEILLDKLDVVNGRLVLPHGQSYSVLVLPDDKRMDLDVINRIQYLVNKGATVIGPPPQTVHGLHDYVNQEQQLAGIANELWGPCDSVNVQENSFGQGKIIWGKTPRQVLADAGMVQDFSYEAPVEIRLEYIHRQLENLDIYFVRNVDSLTAHIETTFRSVGVPELWDPDTGEMFPIPVYEVNQNTTTLPLRFSPYDSYVIIFRTDRQGKHIAEISKAGKRLFPGEGGFNFAGMANGALGLTFDEGGVFDIKYSSGEEDKFEATETWRKTVAGPWEASFGPGWDAPSTITFDTLVAWDQHPEGGIQVYSGVAAYNTSFELENVNEADFVWTLDLGSVYEVSEVKLNGVDLGVRSFAPFTYNLHGTARESNNLTIEVANLLNNRLVGEGRKPEGDRKIKSNIQKLPSAWSEPMGDGTLTKSGLIGPVSVTKHKVYKPEL